MESGPDGGAPWAALDRRLRTAGPAQLCDEALHLSRVVPGLYLAGLPGALLLGAAVAVFVGLHRGSWLAMPLGELLPLRTPLAASLVVLAYALRGVGHGVVARRLAKAWGRTLAPRLAPFTLMAAALLIPAGLVPGAAALILPGVLAAGRGAPLPGLIAADGLGLTEALSASLQRPRAEAWTAGAAAASLGLLVVVLAANLLLGSWLGVQALRMLTGADTTGLARLAGPGSEAALFGAIVLAGVLLDPVLAILRGLVHGAQTTGRSADGLERRWQALLARVGALGAVSLIGAAAPLPAVAAAPPDRPLDEWVSRADAGARQLRDLADGWEGRETIVLAPLRPVLAQGLRGPVALPGGGSLALDPSPLLDTIPDRIDSPESAAATRDAARRLDLIATEAAMLGGLPPQGPALASVLADELAEGRYRLERAAGGEARVRRPGLRERVRRWWDELWRDEAAPAPDPVGEPSARGDQWLVTVVALAVVFGLVGLIARLAARRAAPVRSAPGAAAAVARPRTERPVSSWLRDADAAAEQGALADAVRLAYLGALAGLSELGAVKLAPGRSNGEHLASFQGSDESRAAFARATLRFELSTYGPSVADLAAWGAMRADCLLLVSPDAEVER